MHGPMEASSRGLTKLSRPSRWASQEHQTETERAGGKRERKTTSTGARGAVLMRAELPPQQPFGG